MLFPKILLLTSLAFQYSSSKAVNTKYNNNFTYNFYCSKKNGNLCDTVKKELNNALNSISTLMDFSPAIKFDAFVDDLSKYREDTTKEVFAVTVNSEFNPIDNKYYNIKSPYPNAEKLIKKMGSGKNYTEDDFILLFNNFESNRHYLKNDNNEYKNYAIKEIMKGLLKLNKLKTPYDSVPEGGVPGFLLEKIPMQVIKSMKASNNVSNYEMRSIFPFILDNDICNILERNKNETLLQGISNTQDASCTKFKSNKLNSIFHWKDKLLSHGHPKKLSKKDYKRVVAVGDIHGDYQKLITILRNAKIIDKKNQWIAKKTVLVQIGDLMDREKGIKKILDLMKNLKKQAPKKDSAVHLLLGNHEIDNLQARYFFTSADDIKSFNTLEEREKAFSINGKYGKLLRKEMDVTVAVKDSLFVHAGLYPEFAELGLKKINDHVHNILSTAPSFVDICELKKNQIEHPLYSDEIINGDKSPIGTRDFASLSESEICPEVEKTLTLTNTKRMIVGHTIQNYGEMITRCNDKLIIIDIGMSACYGGFTGYLEILNDKNEMWFRYN